MSTLSKEAVLRIWETRYCGLTVEQQKRFLARTEVDAMTTIMAPYVEGARKTHQKLTVALKHALWRQGHGRGQGPCGCADAEYPSRGRGRSSRSSNSFPNASVRYTGYRNPPTGGIAKKGYW